jgi:hypothetical protein
MLKPSLGRLGKQKVGRIKVERVESGEWRGEEVRK